MVRDTRTDFDPDSVLALLQVVRDVAVDYPLRETFDDCRLADTGLANEDGVVLGSPRQNPHDSANLLLSANDGVLHSKCATITRMELEGTGTVTRTV
ncbi:6-phosphogluconolactonase [Purpureocillium lavendulum]|uniref:6-phosphogluconolactonase n=1 Tax=Purpureocillium lavendulum TaxID=1247861 RepID=A0AB34FBJ4_9HYPO|nr:6-phosphogluconolactonase [Purpureocillium lavendulum]